ncbi:hypothetical protein DFP92_11367 [Yoonia sediminilitoris]|uniref:Uncharacterized protein n=1 Tax=Yoonia sediminilitoris TaxID=1286148 RepID=A0A2T6K9X6_9RHOB|nr:hypothetical protein C8N45_11367 [Yoonia sediminilitoris]RCW91749.1 hypothetical protein DFP92_11367 [Yoonia sediminilitoris]
MKSGLEATAYVGALMHVGQPEFDVGRSARNHSKSKCNSPSLIPEALNTALIDGCTGYFEGLGFEFNMMYGS